MPFNPVASFARVCDDVATLSMILMEKQRAFSRTRPGPPISYEQLLSEAEANPPELTWPAQRKSGRQRIRVGLNGMRRETFVDLFRGGPDADTLLVYHHGLGEIPHDVLIQAIRFGGTRLRRRCDVIAIKGLQHEHPHAVSDLIADRELFSRCLVASASIARRIAQERRTDYKHLVLVGTSMGGVISLIEGAFDPHYDLYIPLIAGPDLADVLLRSVFSRLVQGRYLRQARQADWLDELDLTRFLRDPSGPPIRPLLGRNDKLFRIHKQLEAYARVPRAQVTTCIGGHITAAVRADRLIRHLTRTITDECWSAQAPPPTQEPVLAAAAGGVIHPE